MNYDEEKALLIQAVINLLVEEHELEPIELVIDGRLGSTLGRANLKQRTIRINPLIIGTSSLDDTVRHEVAHFLAAKRGGNGHDGIWKKAAVDCGAEPAAFARFDEAEPKASAVRYRYECGKGCIWYARRKMKRLEDPYAYCIAHHLSITRKDII